MKQVYDYTKPPLKIRFNPVTFLVGMKDCKIILDDIQFKKYICWHYQPSNNVIEMLKRNFITSEIAKDLKRTLETRKIDLEVLYND